MLPHSDIFKFQLSRFQPLAFSLSSHPPPLPLEKVPVNPHWLNAAPII
jgi:hypothetical protein